MKTKLIGVVAVVSLFLFILFSFGSCAKNKAIVGCSHFRSNAYGLNRHILWTGFDGSKKEWNGKIKIEYESGWARCVDLSNGKTFSLAPGICIEEE